MSETNLASPPAVEPSAENQRVITYAQAGVEGVREEMRRNPDIFYIGQGIGPRGGNFQQSRGLWEEFGEARVRDTPIAERAMTGFGIGAALAGSHPIVDIVFLDFTLEAMGEIVQQASTIHYISNGRFKVPFMLRAAGGGVRSTGPHHSHTFWAFFAHIPGLKVVVPSTPYDVKGLIKTGLRDENPVIFIEHKGLYNIKGHVPEEEYLIPFGQARVFRPGRDVTVVSLGKNAPPRPRGGRKAAGARDFGGGDRSANPGSTRQGDDSHFVGQDRPAGNCGRGICHLRHGGRDSSDRGVRSAG